jgi:hypothetical protein
MPIFARSGPLDRTNQKIDPSKVAVLSPTATFNIAACLLAAFCTSE